jgi:hypothetical protein
MKSFLHVLAAMAVMGLAFWAYRENYATQAALREVRALHNEIGLAHARLNMLNAEWAYLNRPDRLRDLADLNFDRLGLLPLLPDGFGKVDQVAYPLAPMLPFTNSVTLSSDRADGIEPL